MRALVVIPARYGAQRFPAKPLAQFRGKPMVVQTYLSCMRSKLADRVVVATDDQRIADAVAQHGGVALMTSPSCENGTERVREAVEQLGAGAADVDIVVNVQGDEPCVDPEHIDAVVRTLREERDESVAVATIATPLRDERAAHDRNVVKCVRTAQGRALYFSRALVPHSKSGAFEPERFPYLRHVGLYAFRRHFLLRLLPALPRSPLQECEDLEQLRVLEAGYGIRVELVPRALPGVDTPEGLADLERLAPLPWPPAPP
eukprot:tig00001065_g6730.t1